MCIECENVRKRICPCQLFNNIYDNIYFLEKRLQFVSQMIEIILDILFTTIGQLLGKKQLQRNKGAFR